VQLVRHEVFPAFADVDDDRDLDLFLSSESSWRFLENTGTARSASFAPPVARPFGLPPT
jgi:hypothetical protein